MVGAICVDRGGLGGKPVVVDEMEAGGIGSVVMVAVGVVVGRVAGALPCLRGGSQAVCLWGLELVGWIPPQRHGSDRLLSACSR